MTCSQARFSLKAFCSDESASIYINCISGRLKKCLKMTTQCHPSSVRQADKPLRVYKVLLFY